MSTILRDETINSDITTKLLASSGIDYFLVSFKLTLEYEQSGLWVFHWNCCGRWQFNFIAVRRTFQSDHQKNYQKLNISIAMQAFFSNQFRCHILERCSHSLFLLSTFTKTKRRKSQMLIIPLYLISSSICEYLLYWFSLIMLFFVLHYILVEW